jgi:predicted RecB family endonuclease
MNYTHHELERINYIKGNMVANLFAEMDDKEILDEAMEDAVMHINEAKGSFPGEDCLQELIDECTIMAAGRVTKAEVRELCKKIEELQSQLANASEYGLEELSKAEGLLI